MSEFADRIAKLSPKRLALLAIDLQSRLEALERSKREPLAIIGMGCRFPGGASNPEEFWRILREGVDAIAEVPPDRWDVEAYYDPNPDAPGKMCTRFGGFLARVDTFDPPFFGISPREAASMDPQQRLLLEVSWEALEHAGQSPDRLYGRAAGVFVGISSGDYSELLSEGDPGAIDAYLGSGTAHSVASGRLSYVLGVRGPSVSIDTACSSSLVAVHLACQSLRTGECRLALAGGVNVILSPTITITLSKARMMAPDGRCKTFDAAADGFVRGEGCGIVVLKRLSDALADGDNILAVIRGTAINQDGRSSGLTAPNGPSQEDVIRDALVNGGVEPGQVGYVEAHGTGTSLGDPIEVQALGAVLGKGRAADRPLRIGSVKTNVGHLEAAAGVAGLIKLVLSLRHGEIPPQLHFTRPNPHIAWDELPLEVVTRATPWPAAAGRRIGGVSSFGFSGTNAHVVVEEAPAPEPARAERERPLHLLALSAKSAPALQDLAQRFERHLAAHPADPLADVCYTAGAGRAHAAHRLALVADSPAQAREGLAAFVAGGSSPRLWSGRAPATAPEIAFLFTGQGSQYAGMGRRLFETQPTFRRALERCDELLRPHLDRPLLSVLYPAPGAESPLDQTAYTQPALFALEYALAEVWRSWGIEPTVVLGHSVGEVVAACVAEVISLEDGLKLIAARGRLMQALPPGGAMAAVFAAEDRVAAAIAPHARSISIAAVNGPDNVVISGEGAAVQAVCEALAGAGIKARPLTVSHAFHSPLMEPMLDAFERMAAEVAYASPRIGLVANLTGQLVTDGDLSADYWRRHVRAPVRFAAGMATLHAKGYRIFLELGPSPTLLGMGRRCLPEGAGAWLPSLRKGRDDWEQMLESLAGLYVRGVEVEWAGFDRDYPRRKVALPTYPFQRERYWIETRPRGPRAAAARPSAERSDGWLYETAWRPAARAGLVTEAPSAPTWGPLAPIAEAVRPLAAELAARHGLQQADELQAPLNALCGSWVLRALLQLGWAPQPGERVSVASLLERLDVRDAHRRLLGRLLETLAEEGLLRAAGGGWEVIKVPRGQDPAEAFQALLARFPVAHVELGLLGRCAAGLADVLRGRRDPLQLLFPGGSLSETETLYGEAPAARVFNGLIQEAIAAAVARLAPERTLRVLEIGGGTGGTTAYVLPRLPAGRTEYVFTDVSRLFTSRAEEKFSTSPCLRARVLDIELDPEAQGFLPHRFDLVLAANVLHATQDLRRTLRHVKRLLAPEGLLVLLEGTQPTRFGDLTVGLTEGWWKFTDTDLRPAYALIPPRRWLDLLAQEGFTDTVAFPEADGRTTLGQQAVILARGPAARAEEASRLHQTPGRWLIFADRAGLGGKLADRLRSRGEHCVLVSAGERFEPPEGDASRLDPRRREDFERLLREGDGMPWRGIVHLWALDVPAAELAHADGLGDAGGLGCGSVLHLVQALAGAGGARSEGLWIVTRGAQPVASEPSVAVAQAPVWGLGKVIALEHPELRCVRVDLDPSEGADEVQLLLDEVTAPDREDQVAFRGDARRVARLVRGAPPPALAAEGDLFAAEATYLITGGLAGLGLLVARWMVERGARHLVLMGRRGATEAAQPVLRELEQAGARIVVVKADVSRDDQVREVLAEIRRSLPPLRGVVHSAGVLDDGVLLQQDLARFATVMAPKVEGAWILHELTRETPLDFFVLFSSGASLVGSPGQGNHAAANAFLDALAHHRRALGLPALSINWGPWAEVGAAAERALEGRMALRGLEPIPPREGLHLLARLMRAASPQVGALAMDWTQLAQDLPAGLPFYSELSAAIPAAGQERPGPTEPPAPPLAEQLRQAPPDRRWDLLHASVRGEVVKVLGLDPSRQIETDRPLQELGLDSLMAVELRNAWARALGLALPSTLLLEGPTVSELTTLLLTRLAEQEAGSDHTVGAGGEGRAQAGRPGMDQEQARRLLGKLDQFSDREVDSLLSEMLASGREDE